MSKWIELSKVVKYSDDRIPISEITADEYITTDNLLPNKLGVIPAAKLPKGTQQLVKFSKNDILLGNIRPYLKKIWRATKGGGCSPDVLVLKVDDKFDPKFVYYNLFQDNFFEHVMRGSKGTKMPRGDKNHILRYLIPDYSKVEQEAASRLLSLLDEKIENTSNICKQISNLITLTYDYWFIQYEFPDESGKPYKSSGGQMVWNERLKENIPKGWDVSRLSSIADLGNETISPIDSPAEKFRYYNLPDFDESGTYVIESGDQIKSNKFIVNPNDLLVSKLNPWFSRVVYATQEPKQICSTEFVVWRASNKNIKNYLYMIAKDSRFIDFCTKSSSGTSNSHKRVNPTIMMSYQIPYNNLIVDKFGQKIESNIDLLTQGIAEINQLSKLRSWLIPLFINGKVKVVGC
jgi:type I restriction enzyme S subunit